MPTYFQGAELQDFDQAVIGTVTQVTTAGTFDAGNARCSLSVASGTELVNAFGGTFNAGTNEFWFHFVHLVPSGTTNGSTSRSAFMRLMEGSTDRLGLQWATSGNDSLALRKFASGTWTTLATVDTTGVLPQGLLCKFDIYVKLGNPGTVRVYIHGMPYIAQETLDLTWSGSAGVLDGCRFTNAHGANGGVRISEVIAASWPTVGARLVTVVPASNGTYTEWTGSDFNAVDEIDPAADVITSSVADQRLSFNLTNFPALNTGEVIESVRTTAWANRGVTGPLSLNHFARISGVDYHNANGALVGTFGTNSSYFQSNPATSGAWDLTALNDAEFGVRSRA